MNKQKKERQEKLKDRQREIIDHLFRFRHLNRFHIQTMLNHKYWAKVIVWLNELTEKRYVYKIYEKEVGRKPTEYCLDKESIPYLRGKGTSEKLIKSIYTEKTNSQTFRAHCQCIATIYLSLLMLMKKTQGTLSFYTKRELDDIKYLPYPHPDCYFAITDKHGQIKRYFLDVFDNDKFLYKRVYQYFYYFKKHYWQDHTSKPFPEIILVCPSNNVKQKISIFIQKKFSNESPAFYLSTWGEIQTQGMSSSVLTKVE